MDIICSVTPAFSSSFAIPFLKDVLTEDLIRPTEIEQENLPSSRTPLRLKFIKLNEPLNAFELSAWVATWLLSSWQHLWTDNMQTVNTGHHQGWASTFFMPIIDIKFTILLLFCQQCTSLQNNFPSMIWHPLSLSTSCFTGSQFPSRNSKINQVPSNRFAENRRLSPNDGIFWFH